MAKALVDQNLTPAEIPTVYADFRILCPDDFFPYIIGALSHLAEPGMWEDTPDGMTKDEIAEYFAALLSVWVTADVC